MANIAKLIKGGYTVAKKAISGIKKKSDLEKLADQIRKQSKTAQTPGNTLRKPGKSKVEKSASAFVKRRQQLAGAKRASGKMAQRTGPSKKEVVGYGTAAGTGLIASSQIKKRSKKRTIKKGTR